MDQGAMGKIKARFATVSGRTKEKRRIQDIVGQYTQDKCDDFFDLPLNRNKFSVITGGMASFLLSKQANIRFVLNPFFSV